MFTSRAEYRLLLREDNADLRLTPVGRELGVVDEERWKVFEHKRDAIVRETARLQSEFVSAGFHKRASKYDLLRRPELGYSDVETASQVTTEVAAQVEIQAKYEGYIDRQRDEVERRKGLESQPLPEDLDYGAVRGLSNEARQKLAQHRPQTIGQASRVSGITPAAISLLLVHLKKSRQTLRKKTA
jgi:tRNA uridine 5-carboxymethylaminomethyl modification enzyme